MKLLLADENFSFPVVEHLRAKGHDVVTIKELGRSGEGFPDDAVLALAVSLERAVLTFNRKDFKALHRKSSEHKGIIMCTYNPDFPQLAQIIHDAISIYPSLQGEIIRIYRP